MTFSGALTLADLNDYITPSQACIKPLEQSNAPKARTPGDAATEIHIDASGAYYEVGQDRDSSVGTTRKLQTAEVSLNDCLACSGCITSAESVLITLQSHTEVLSVLSANPSPGSPGHRVPVLSIAPQSLASLAAALGGPSSSPVPLARMLNRVRTFATRTLGFAHAFDTTFAREIVLREHVREFFERKERVASGGGGALPMLASACPGWVCYAEKTHGEMLPFIAATKSPQQVMGTLVKEWLAPHYWDKHPDEVYHVTVMPCYDKKLEASRSDFYNEHYSTRDVDCVITTGELLLLAQEHGIDLSLPAPDEDISLSPNFNSATPVLPDLLTHTGSSSGSYLHSLMLAVSHAHPRPLTLESKTIRSADYVEHTLRDSSSGSPVFRGATCYGFRNLQNVVRRVGRAAGVQVGRGAAGRLAGGLRNNRTGAATGAGGAGVGAVYNYVEVMACPGGCVGGGGQLRAPERKGVSGTSTSTNHDAEGFVRDWAADGVRPVHEEGENTVRTGTAEAPWSSRAWTREVERAYWGAGRASDEPERKTALPTPPASPKPETRGGGGVDVVGAELPATTESRARAKGLGGGGGGGGGGGAVSQRSFSFGAVDDEQEREKKVEWLVARVLRELCAPPLRQEQEYEGERVGSEDTWVSEMAEMRRRVLFRTQYRVVESEVVGLGVKW